MKGNTPHSLYLESHCSERKRCHWPQAASQLQCRLMGEVTPCCVRFHTHGLRSTGAALKKTMFTLSFIWHRSYRHTSCSAEPFDTLLLFTQSQVLCALWKLFLIRTQKVPLLLNLMDELLAGMWNCPGPRFGSRKCYSSRGDTLWLKYLRQDRNVMAQRMWVTVTHDWTDYCVQTLERPFELRCLPLLCWG